MNAWANFVIDSHAHPWFAAEAAEFVGQSHLCVGFSFLQVCCPVASLHMCRTRLHCRGGYQWRDRKRCPADSEGGDACDDPCPSRNHGSFMIAARHLVIKSNRQTAWSATQGALRCADREGSDAGQRQAADDHHGGGGAARHEGVRLVCPRRQGESPAAVLFSVC